TRCTPAAVEQDHLRVVIDSNPKIPNRTEALFSGETGPIVEALGQTARNLEAAGAEIIGIPCNTAHAFLDDVRAAVDIPVADMVGETARRARKAYGSGATVGLVATDGTLRSRLYHDALEEVGLNPLAPPESGVQFAVMDALDSVKLDGVTEDACSALAMAVEDLTAHGVTALIAGCTEASLVFVRRPPGLPWLDPLQILAEALVREATGDRSEVEA
ncbi:MAG: amino acid racemase, partial [Acidobacteriota bacterium]